MQFHAGSKGRRPFALVARARWRGARSRPNLDAGHDPWPAAARRCTLRPRAADAALDWDRQVAAVHAVTLRLAKSRARHGDGGPHPRSLRSVLRRSARLRRAARPPERRRQAVSVFGTVHPDIAIDATPALTIEQARGSRHRLTGGQLRRIATRTARPAARRRRERTVRAGVAGRSRDARRRLQPVRRREDRRRGRSATRTSRPSRGRHAARGVARRQQENQRQPRRPTVADDRLRPPTIVTYDMQRQPRATIDILDGLIDRRTTDIASDTDNNWTDGAGVDAHV